MALWKDLPSEFSSLTAVLLTFNRWSASGITTYNVMFSGNSSMVLAAYFPFSMIPCPVPSNPVPYLGSCLIFLCKCEFDRTEILATSSYWSPRYFQCERYLCNPRAMWLSSVSHFQFFSPHMGHMGLWRTLSDSNMTIYFGKTETHFSFTCIELFSYSRISPSCYSCSHECVVYIFMMPPLPWVLIGGLIVSLWLLHPRQNLGMLPVYCTLLHPTPCARRSLH